MKYLIGLALLAALLWLTNPNKIQHKTKVKEFLQDYISRLNQPYMASGNADSLSKGLRAKQGFDLMADSMIENACSVDNYYLFSFTVMDKKTRKKAGIGIFGKVYLFDRFTTEAKL